jgi:hypothetical protein
MGEVFEGEAVEVGSAPGTEAVRVATRPLPAPVTPVGDVAAWKAEVRTAAIAAAGGIVAGAATVAVVRATRAASPRKRASRSLRGRDNVVASRSFLVDVHLLGSK